MEKETISVIVPVYNVADYLEECVISIINQTYKNLEIILVDDGSTDNSSKICDDFSKKETRIKVIHKENGGIGKARNSGVELATGEYLAFIDSDDCIKETFIEELYKLLKETDSDIAGCRFYRNVPNTTDYVYPKESEDYNFVTDSEGIMKRLYNDMGVFCVVWNKLYKKDIIKKHPFTDIKIAEDAYIMREYMFEAKKIAWTSKALYMYRDRPGSIMTSKRNFSIEEQEQRMFWLEKHIAYYKANKMDELQALAEKVFLFNIHEVWSDLDKGAKKFYKSKYFEKYGHMLKAKGNPIKSKIKYTIFAIKLVLS